MDATDEKNEELTTRVIPKIDKNDFKGMESSDIKIESDVQEVVSAIRLFLDSKVTEAESQCYLKYSKSLIHTHGTSVLAVLKAVMTFDDKDIDFAMGSLKYDVEASSYLRKEQSMLSSFSGMFYGAQKSKNDMIKTMTLQQKHAEVTYAESYLLKAILSIFTESGMVTFMKEGLAIRHSYTIYKTCYKYLQNALEEEGENWLSENVDNRFITSVYLGLGCFNLILSILPSKLLKVFEMIGFGGHRDFGMQCLSLGAAWSIKETLNEPNAPKSSKKQKMKTLKVKEATNFFVSDLKCEEEPGSRRFLCEIMLYSYHIFLSTMVQLPNCNFPLSGKQLLKSLEKHPNSFLYLIFQGKVLLLNKFSQAERKIEKSINEFKKVVQVQKDWRQLAHVCFWDIGISYGIIQQYEESASYFDILFKENNWSKAIYSYLKAVMLYTADKQKHNAVIVETLNEIPNLVKKVAGKSIPLEKFVARKARKFFLQNNRLLLPAYEILYMWNGFDLMPDKYLEKIVIEIDFVLNDLNDQQTKHKSLKNEPIPYSTYYDDLCLARFFKGLATRELAAPSSDILIPEKDLILLKLTNAQRDEFDYAQKQLEYISLQADDIEFDHWILPFARYELGRLHMRAGNYQKSREEFKAALNGGYGENEVGQQKRKASMESSLHLRIHNANLKLKLLESLAGVEVEIDDMTGMGEGNSDDD